MEYRAAERAPALELSKENADYHDKMGEYYNEVALINLTTARRTLKQARSAWEPQLVAQLDEMARSEELRRHLATAGKVLVEEIHKADVFPDEAKEILGLWKNVC